MPADFAPLDCDTPQLFPPSVQDYLSEQARFVVESVDQLDLQHPVGAYRGTGSAAYPPAMLVGLLFCGYAAGVFSERKLAQATCDSVGFRFSCTDTHPDHREIADFRARVFNALEGLFVDILLIGQTRGLAKLGAFSVDGPKFKAKASKPEALSCALFPILYRPG